MTSARSGASGVPPWGSSAWSCGGLRLVDLPRRARRKSRASASFGKRFRLSLGLWLGSRFRVVGARRLLGIRARPRKYPPRVNAVNDDLSKEWEQESPP